MIKKIFKGYEKLHGSKAVETEAVILTANTIWKDNNQETGILAKESFMPFVESLRPSDYEHTDYLFKLLRERTRFSSSLKLRTDRGGNLYYWAGVSRPNGNDGAKVMANTELVNLVQQYINGKVYIDFDLDDLIDEGLNQQ